MCAEPACLVIRMKGPMQSWGFSSQYKLRGTGLMPSKSGVAGLCCAALGAKRGSRREQKILETFRSIPMLSVCMTERFNLTRIQDFHTVLGVVSAEGKSRPYAELTRREYLQDGDFLVFLNADGSFLQELAEALRNPIWGPWLGRKACIPSAPVFAGLYANEQEALTAPALGVGPLTARNWEREVARFEDGTDSYPDQALGFEANARQFGIRRILRRSASQ